MGILNKVVGGVRKVAGKAGALERKVVRKATDVEKKVVGGIKKGAGKVKDAAVKVEQFGVAAKKEWDTDKAAFEKAVYGADFSGYEDFARKHNLFPGFIEGWDQAIRNAKTLGNAALNSTTAGKAIGDAYKHYGEAGQIALDSVKGAAKKQFEIDGNKDRQGYDNLQKYNKYKNAVIDVVDDLRLL